VISLTLGDGVDALGPWYMTTMAFVVDKRHSKLVINITFTGWLTQCHCEVSIITGYFSPLYMWLSNKTNKIQQSVHHKVFRGRANSVFSPHLFAVYIDQLRPIRTSETSGHWCVIHGVYLGCIVYADDIFLISHSSSSIAFTF